MVKYCTEAALSKICQLHRFIDFIWCFRYAGARTVATIVKKLNYHYFLTCKCKHHIWTRGYVLPDFHCYNQQF